MNQQRRARELEMVNKDAEREFIRTQTRKFEQQDWKEQEARFKANRDLADNYLAQMSSKKLT